MGNISKTSWWKNRSNCRGGNGDWRQSRILAGWGEGGEPGKENMLAIIQVVNCYYRLCLLSRTEEKYTIITECASYYWLLSKDQMTIIYYQANEQMSVVKLMNQMEMVPLHELLLPSNGSSFQNGSKALSVRGSFLSRRGDRARPCVRLQIVFAGVRFKTIKNLFYEKPYIVNYYSFDNAVLI